MINIRLKYLNRILLFVFSILLLTFIGIKPNNSVLAEEGSLPLVTVESKTVHRGETFEIDVNLDRNPGLTAMILELKYDKSVMSLVGIERGNALPSHTFTTTNTDTEEGFLIDNFRLLWDGTKQDFATGRLVTLRFESKITAEPGKYLIEFTYDKQNTTSNYGQTIPVEIINGEVELTTGKFKVVYKNYDGTELQVRDYNDGEVPEYTGPTPTREQDEKYIYTFANRWKGEVSNEPNTICYVAVYSTTPQEYQVLFYVDGEYFAGDRYDYNEFIDLSITPSKKNHYFSGWHLDKDFTQKVSSLRMPAKNIVLYGYMKYNIRETNIPEIVLTYQKTENEIAFVDVNVANNPGLAGLILTLEYDREVLEFVGFEQGETLKSLQFSTTNTEEGFNSNPFKFYWESAINNFGTGKILTLKFKEKENAKPGIYDVSFSYNEDRDATFFAEDDELWYTKLNIIEAKVPVGHISHYEEEMDDGTKVEITLEEAVDPETVLEIKRITNKISIPEETIIATVGEGMEVKDVYSIRLLLNGVEIQPEGKILIKIQLTKDQLKSKQLMVYNIDENNQMIKHSSNVQDGSIVFETESLLNNWAIIGDITTVETITPANASMLIICLSLLIIAIMGLLLILKARLRKKK